MTVDQYAICPCGNGKKIKFCKCKDSLPELDRVMTMIEGNQVVPAIDKLNQVLSDHPDAAWALAIKGRLMMELREYDKLAENADRFVRLQPSNPIALSQRAAAQMFHGAIDKATLSLLEALTESGRSVDTSVLEMASMLSYALVGEGLYLTARAYVQLPLTAQGYEPDQTAAAVFQELNTRPGINQLLKAVPTQLPRDEDESWGERFDEAIGLLRSNQILLAEAKLQSLSRTVPLAPCVLTGLLTCAIWRGDGQGQTDCLRKLSECEPLELNERSNYLAMSWLVDPSLAMMTIPAVHLEADLGNVDEALMALTANSRCLQMGNDVLSQFREAEDGIPPRAGFQLLDRELPAPGSALKMEEIPTSLGIVLIHGRQTDRAPRIEALEVRPADRTEVTALLQQCVGELSWREQPGRLMPLVEAVQRPIAFIAETTTRKEVMAIQRARLETMLPAQLAETTLPCLGNRALKDVASDPSTLLARTALIRMLEGDESLEDHDDVVMSAVRQLAGVSPLPALHVSTMEEAGQLSPADLSRVEVDRLDSNAVLMLFQRARQLDCGKLLRRTARHIVELDLTESLRPAKLLAWHALVEFAQSPVEALGLIEQAKAYAATYQLDQANLRMLELSYCLVSGDQVRFSNSLKFITDNYGKRPDVMARLQQLLISLGVIRPDGTARQPGSAAASRSPNLTTAAAAPSSGIWTPGSGSPAAAPAASAPPSKLWIPGMD